MKILIFTDIPPTHALTAGLVLDRVVRFLPKGSVVCFAALGPWIEGPRPADLPWMPVYYTSKPPEQGSQRFARIPVLNHLWGALNEIWKHKTQGAEILRKAVAFGRQHKVDAVLGVLQGQTMINLAAPLAKELNVPLYTLVWDPFSWWVRGHRLDPYTDKRTRKAFDEAIRKSQAVATASWAMADHYRAKYGVRAVPVIASHDKAMAKSPYPSLQHADRVTIGMAGQFYASAEWAQMILALECADWKIGGRDIYIRTMGGSPPPESKIPPGQIEYLGWKSQPEMVAALSECDILYCPYPFTGELAEVSALSFPSKLVAYFAAGRPAIFHGPLDSSPGRYVVEHEAALGVGTPYASSIYNAMEALVTQPDLYRRIAENGQRAFAADFTLGRMRDYFYEFLGIPDDPEAVEASTADPIDVIDDRKLSRPLSIGRIIFGWFPPLGAMFKQIDTLEDMVGDLETINAIQTAELSMFYRLALDHMGETVKVKDQIRA